MRAVGLSAWRMANPISSGAIRPENRAMLASIRTRWLLAATRTAHHRARVGYRGLDVIVKALSNRQAAGLGVPPISGVEEAFASMTQAFTLRARLGCGHSHLHRV